MPGLDEVGHTKAGEFVRPRFGVEIEFSNTDSWTSEQAVVEALCKAGLQASVEGYGHSVRSYWKLTTDSSVDGVGLELVSPPMHFADRHSIGLAMKVLRENGARVTARCGFHVHHEWPWQVVYSQPRTRENGGRLRPEGEIVVSNRREEQRGRLGQLLWMYDKFLPLVGVLIPRGRLTVDSQHTHSNKRNSWASQWSDDRYVAVNFVPLRDGRNTVEFRQHQGTLNAAKALAWVEFTRQLIGVATNEYFPREISHDTGRPTDYVDWSAGMSTRVVDVLGKVTPASKRYLEQRCQDKGTSLGQVMELVTARDPDDPWLYGSDNAIWERHAADVERTLGARSFEPSDT